MKQFCLALLFISVFCDIANSQIFYLPKYKQYSNAIVSLNGFRKFEAKDLKINNDSIVFLNTLSNRIVTASLMDVNYLRVKSGTYIGECALIGGLITSLSFILAVVKVSSNTNFSMNGTVIGIGLGFAGGGVLLGGLIGAMIPKWKSYYVNTGNSFIKNANPDLYIGYNSIGLSVKLSIN